MQKQSGRRVCAITEEEPSSFKYSAEFSPEVPGNLTESLINGIVSSGEIAECLGSQRPTSLLQGDCMLSNRVLQYPSFPERMKLGAFENTFRFF